MDTSKDANKLNAIASAKGLNISPTDPDTNASGKNTIIVTIVEDRIGLTTSLVALMTKLLPDNSSLGSIIFDKYSLQQQLSHLSRLIAIVNAPNVKMFSDTSLNFNAISAIKIESGMETIEIAVVLIFLKNNKITIIATIVPKAAFQPLYIMNLQLV